MTPVFAGAGALSLSPGLGLSGRLPTFCPALHFVCLPGSPRSACHFPVGLSGFWLVPICSLHLDRPGEDGPGGRPCLLPHLPRLPESHLLLPREPGCRERKGQPQHHPECPRFYPETSGKRLRCSDRRQQINVIMAAESDFPFWLWRDREGNVWNP